MMTREQYVTKQAELEAEARLKSIERERELEEQRHKLIYDLLDELSKFIENTTGKCNYLSSNSTIENIDLLNAEVVDQLVAKLSFKYDFLEFEVRTPDFYARRCNLVWKLKDEKKC